jgi:hypothetical protein
MSHWVQSKRNGRIPDHGWLLLLPHAEPYPTTHLLNVEVLILHYPPHHPRQGSEGCHWGEYRIAPVLLSACCSGSRRPGRRASVHALFVVGSFIAFQEVGPPAQAYPAYPYWRVSRSQSRKSTLFP